jgi:hypothetical protein
MKPVALSVVALLFSPAPVLAGLATDSVVQCWNKQEDEISLTCNIVETTDGGRRGACLVSTYLGGWKGVRADWVLEGRIEAVGGSHSIVKKEKSLLYDFAPGAFGCVISPPPGYTYAIGDCEMKGAVKTCFISTQVDGSNKYFHVTAAARPY